MIESQRLQENVYAAHFGIVLNILQLCFELVFLVVMIKCIDFVLKLCLIWHAGRQPSLKCTRGEQDLHPTMHHIMFSIGHTLCLRPFWEARQSPDLLLKDLDAAHDFIAYTLVHEADYCSHEVCYALSSTLYSCMFAQPN